MSELDALLLIGLLVGVVHGLGRAEIIPNYGWQPDFPAWVKLGIAAFGLSLALSFAGSESWKLGLAFLGAFKVAQWTTDLIIELIDSVRS